MDDRDPPLRPLPAALWLGLIMALALIFAASFTRPAAAEGAMSAASHMPGNRESR